eukprot:Phypoly_transcript_13889.p1 GENE.Phypoly_transcript_13889~~Phypoly_transcript_13889.p1  ORF type:complete len:206 (+),score=16.64 Phypoly_transcript_13889:320-937(+)
MSCGCKDHNHADDLADRGQEYSLFKHIAIDGVTCLNESSPGSCKNVFKPFDQRLDTTKFLESNEDDPEFILHIPFTGVVKLKSIVIIGGENGKHPNKVKAYVNKENLDFSTATSVKPAQEWDLHEDFKGEIEYTTRMVNFVNVSHLTLFFPTNFGADCSRVYYIGLKGEYTEMKRQAVTAVYESRPQLSDHKQDSGPNAFSRTLH